MGGEGGGGDADAGALANEAQAFESGLEAGFGAIGIELGSDGGKEDGTVVESEGAVEPVVHAVAVAETSVDDGEVASLAVAGEGFQFGDD